VKRRDHENLTAVNIEKVLGLLSKDEKPITKKEACEILNISYNTTRLSKIIVEYQERKQYVAERKATNKGKKAAEFEITEAITNYLQGESISEIAAGLYRSSGFVRAILDRVGVPQRPANIEDRKGPCMIPENCVADTFSAGDKVWSARYHAPAIVDAEVEVQNKYESKGYRVYILENTENDNVGGFYAFVLACEMGKLSHLEEYGVNLSKI
tara:strand:+ start:263 stop:898 length:636 start_codon:yes stop_codon:yes gene_type:complete